MPNEIPLRLYLACPDEEKPAVYYNGKLVTNVYRDQAYKASTRYVIVTGSIGSAGKSADTVVTTDPPSTEEPMTETNEQHTAEFTHSAQFTLLSPNGVPITIMVHGQKLKDVIAQADQEATWLVNNKWMSLPVAAPPPAPNGGVKSTASTGEMGADRVSLIKVATSRTKGAPQLIFKLAGENKNLYAQAKDFPELLKFLSRATKPTGKPFVIDDMKPGNEWGGAWDVSWKVNGEFRNITEVVNATE